MKMIIAYRQLLLAAFLTGIGLMSNVRGQGTTFTYQGRLNQNGAPANGIYDFRFRVATDSLGSTVVGRPFFTNGIPVAGGLFTVGVDLGNLFTATNLFLETSV